MRSFVVGACFALLASLALLGGPAARSEPPGKGEPALAAAIIDKAIRARGGEAALARFPAVTWKGKGTIHVRDRIVLSSDEGAERLPERMWSRSEIRDGGTTTRETVVVVGDQGWTVTDGKTEAMAKERVAEQRERMYAEWLNRLTPLKGEGFHLAPLGESRVGDRAVLGVLVSHDGHRDVKLFFDKEGGLLLKSETRIRLAESGRELTREILYGRYEAVRGVQYPRHLTIRAGGGVWVEADLTELQPRERLEDALFVRPKD